MILAHPVPPRYRRPILGAPDPQLRKALTVSSALGAAWLVLVWLAPAVPVHETQVDELPERLARLIVDEPRPVAPTPSTNHAAVELPAAPETPLPEVAEPTPAAPTQERVTPHPRRQEPVLAEDRGRAGREQARTEVTRELEKVGAEVDRTLESLASVLPTATQDGAATASPQRPGGRAPRAGRSGAATGGGSTRATTTATELGAGTLAAGISDLGALGALDLASVTGSANAPATGSNLQGGTGDRSAASLLAVVRRYAPGIRFCYDTALERDRTLRGKMVFRLTVAPDGSVSGVEVVEDTLGSTDVRRCALAQIEAWRFATAPSASVFDAPFVFRPTE